MADGRRVGRSGQHEGIILRCRVHPSGREGWQARYWDPDLRRSKDETIPAEHASTDEKRRAWAKARAEELAERGRVIAKGAPTKKNVSLTHALERFFEDNSASLRPGSVRNYRGTQSVILEWAGKRGVVLGDELRGEHLVDLHAFVKNKKRLAPKKGGGRRDRIEIPKVRGAHTVNRELREARRILGYLRRLGLVPLLTGDDIKDNLKNVPAPSVVPEYMRLPELKSLIEAARRHDADTFAMTREEKARGETEGETSRYEPVLPYVAVTLLTGMRRDESRLLRWEAVDLRAAPAGRITLRPEDVKTHKGRVVDLVVSKVLSELLTTMHLRSGGVGFVFGGTEALSHDELKAMKKRLQTDHGAPAKFTWKKLRATCATYLANAPGIFGSTSVFREAKQLGHSVAVAEKHYLDVVHVDAKAKTLEAAMEIDAVLREALGLPKGRAKASAAAT